MKSSPNPQNSGHAPRIDLARRAALALLALALAFTLVRALQTQEVEIGNAGAYDGSVKITRDAQGRMLLADSQVATPVSLNDLRYAGRDHGLLLGLGDDDHPQYLNATRFATTHAGAHTAEFNGALATPADVRGNATLGAHLADSAIHLNRTLAETVSARWLFSGLSSGNTLKVTGGATLDSVNYGELWLAGGLGAPNYSQIIFGNGTGYQLNFASRLAGVTTNQITFTDTGAVTCRALTINGPNGIGITSPYAGNAYLYLKNASNGGFDWYISAGRQGIADNGLFFYDNRNAKICATMDNGNVAVAGDLNVGSGAAKLTLNGQRLLNETNLLDNPDFTLWQRNVSQLCASGGNAAGTITWPVPGTLSIGADRWQVSRAKTDMSSTLGRATPPAGLTTAQYCLKNEYASGTACTQYIHQTVPREVTAGLRGRWVTFAISHYLNGAGGGSIGIYKVVGGTPTALNVYTFTSTANAWERLAVAAQVPTDAEVLLVGIASNLASGGPTIAYVANASLVEGKYAGTSEKVSDLAAACVPPLPRRPAEDLAACQRYFEKGSFDATFTAPDTSINYYYTSVRFNTAKAAGATIALGNLSTGALSNPTVGTQEQPAYSAGQAYPQGFRFYAGGAMIAPALVIVSADWTASCPEPL